MQRATQQLRRAATAPLCQCIRQPATVSARRWIATTQPLIPEQHSSTSSAASTSAAASSSMPSSHPEAAAASPSSSSLPVPSPSQSREKHKYRVRRTVKNLELPVYSEVKNNGTRRSILVRHIEGDLLVGYTSSYTDLCMD